MSLKAIEMQIALPCTHEAAKIQEGWQLRDQVAFHHAANEMQKEDEKQRSAVLKQEQKEKPSFHSGNGSSGQGAGGRQHEKKKTTGTKRKNSQHPYKGTSIDFSG
ncbi:hypothetical protein [Peribacillus glennii]|uniref:Uncharacterized protein n=1 Tax=Peribacillus glennii TaxID=2303991 RepID=A0A372L870_9BACI|nr:hypothetical protein [Peribacillus glennii]RFU61553.1 hypothetical protein D0466_17270 [Peribacillus glennii]